MPIVVLGKSSNESITSLAEKILRENFEGLQIKNSCRISPDFENRSAPSLYICESSPEFKTDSGILIFKNRVKAREELKIPDGFVCIFDSSNQDAIKRLSSSGAVAITCGTSGKDTFSIASLTRRTAVISLQRSVRTLNGNVLEAGDVVLGLSDTYEPYDITAVCALALLLEIDLKKL